jgi:hypothetical protein
MEKDIRPKRIATLSSWGMATLYKPRKQKLQTKPATLPMMILSRPPGPNRLNTYCCYPVVIGDLLMVICH